MNSRRMEAIVSISEGTSNVWMETYLIGSVGSDTSTVDAFRNELLEFTNSLTLTPGVSSGRGLEVMIV